MFDLAGPHGMEPALFRHLEAVDGRGVPPDAWARIHNAQHLNARRTLAAAAELSRVLADLGAEGVRPLVYKGPVLAMQLYGDVGGRRYVDLDVIVPRPQMAAARASVLRRGYVPDSELPGWQFERYLRTQKEIAFIHPESSQAIDLQWAFTPAFFGLRWNLPRMWERSVEVTLAGSTTVRTFCFDDLALILCVHGSLHLWERLAWIADLGVFVAKDLADWGVVLAEAERIGALTMVLTALALAHRMTGCGIPLEVELTRKASRLADQLHARFHEPFVPGRHEESPFHLTLVRMRERPTDQIRYATLLALTPTVRDWEALPLPQALAFLSIVLRPMRLLARYLSRLVRAGRG